MPISIKCLDCNTETTVSDAAAGKTARCPKCGNYIRVPGERIDVVPARSSFPVAPIVGALVIVALGCGVAWYLGFFNPPPPQPPLPTTPASPTAVVSNTATETASSTSTGTAKTVAKPTVENMSWADAPGSAIVVAGINQPSNLIETWMTLLNKMTGTNPMLASQWQAMRQKAADYLGADLANPKNFAAVGIDIDKPMTMALLELDAKGEPTGVVLSVGITNQETIMTMVRRIAQKENTELKEDSAAQPTVFLSGTDTALSINDNRIYLFGAKREDRAKVLREYLVSKDRGSIREQSSFKTAMTAINGPGEATAYVDLKTILSHLPGTARQPIASDFLSLGLKSSPNENVVCLNLVPNSRLLRDLKLGAPCREFMGKLERPFAAITLGLSDSLDFIQYIAENSGPGVADMLRTQLQTGTGLAFDEFRDAVSGGNMGMLLYKAQHDSSGAPIDMPYTSALWFLNVPSKNAAKIEKLRAAIGKGLNKLGTLSPIMAKYKFNAVTADDYIVFGDATEQITACAQPDFGKPRWSPQYGNDEALAMEFFVADLKALPRVSVRMDDNPFYAFDKLQFGFIQRGESLVYSTGALEVSNAGLAIVAAIAIPSLLRSRMAANEMAAVASCRFFCEAQEIYHRADYHGDGTLQYAQSLKGDFSLYEKKAGLGDLALIDRSFAEAEGSPSQNPKPKAGYCFKVLTAQGPDAVGGKRNYIVNKRMLLGYALVAYPIAYDSTGRNTFLINGTGTIFQKDLGPTTPQIVEQMKEYNPDATWIPFR